MTGHKVTRYKGHTQFMICGKAPESQLPVRPALKPTVDSSRPPGPKHAVIPHDLSRLTPSTGVAERG